MDYAKNEVINSAKNIIISLTAKHNIKAAYIFGSYSRGTQSHYSDIDLAVVLEKIRDGSPFNQAFEIFNEVQEKDPLFEVVCFSENEFINDEQEVIKHIKKDGIKIY